MANRNHGTGCNEQPLFNSIKLFFPDLEIDIRDLKNPTTTAVINFYSAFLYEMGVDVCNLNQVQITQMTVISHADMYNQTIPCINMYQALSYFLTNIGINDFCFSDLVNPTPKRTLTHMTAVMSFLEYCDNAVSNLNPKLDKVLSLRQKKGELLSKIETVKKDINLRATNRVKRTENTKELMILMDKEKSKFDELFKEKEIQKQAMESIKKLVVQDEEKEKNFERIAKDLQEEIEGLNNIIVKSPEKLKNELHHLTGKRDECAESVKITKSQIEDKNKLLHNLTSETEEQKLRHQKLNELLEIKNSIEQLKRQLESYKGKHQTFLEEIEELSQQISSSTQKNKNLKSQLEELKVRKQKQDRENKEILAQAEKEYSELVLKKEKQLQNAYEIQKKINDLDEEEKRLKIKINKFYENSKKAYESLEMKEKEIKEDFDKIIEASKRRNQRLLEEDCT